VNPRFFPVDTYQDFNIIRRLNKATVFDAVRVNQDGISRADVARVTNLSRATVSAIVGDLLMAGLVREARVGVSRGGRRPTILELNSEAGRVLAVDIGATHLVVALGDLRGRLLGEHSAALNVAAGPEHCLAIVDAAVRTVLAAGNIELGQVTSISVGVPGPVVAKLGMVIAPPIMPGWDGFPIQDRLREMWGRPAFVDNDADLGALGEWTFGAARGESNLAYVKVGTGIGCGILINGAIYRGVLGTAGEIGHFSISEDGPPCTCGNNGCLEAMAGGRAIAQRAQMAVKAGQRTTLSALNHAHELTAKDVAAAAQNGDAVSQQLLSDAGRHIGSALASLINLLNPGLVLIGGGVASSGDHFVNPLRAAVRERSMLASFQATRIELATLGAKSTVLGGIAVALNRTFKSYVESA
jgi:glucokinase-like ROK family protein